jgi:hypothetical protein
LHLEEYIICKTSFLGKYGDGYKFEPYVLCVSSTKHKNNLVLKIAEELVENVEHLDLIGGIRSEIVFKSVESIPLGKKGSMYWLSSGMSSKVVFCPSFL